MKRKIKIRWTCSDFSHHEHKYKLMAWLCGKLQLMGRYKMKQKWILVFILEIVGYVILLIENWHFAIGIFFIEWAINRRSHK